MVAGGAVARGYLRPGFARSPPLLLIALILISGISVFNYWNLSAQYSDVVKEITELQEHTRVVTNKYEAAEKQVTSMKQLLKDASDEQGKLRVKTTEALYKLKEKEKLLLLKSEDIAALERNIKTLEDSAKQRDAEVAKQGDMQQEMVQLKSENSMLKEKNSVLQKTLSELQVKMSVMVNSARRFQVPNIVRAGLPKTADSVRGQLKLLDSHKVHVRGKSQLGMTIHPGGPLVFARPGELTEPQAHLSIKPNNQDLNQTKEVEVEQVNDKVEEERAPEEIHEGNAEPSAISAGNVAVTDLGNNNVQDNQNVQENDKVHVVSNVKDNLRRAKLFDTVTSARNLTQIFNLIPPPMQETVNRPVTSH